jgi:hypothetical protein
VFVDVVTAKVNVTEMPITKLGTDLQI